MAKDIWRELLNHYASARPGTTISGRPHRAMKISRLRGHRRIRMLQLLIEGIHKRQYFIDTGLDRMYKRNSSVLRAGEKELERLDDVVDEIQRLKLSQKLRYQTKSYSKKKKATTRRRAVKRRKSS